MRAGPILLTLFLLAACQMTGGQTAPPGGLEGGLAGEEIAVTSLDAPPGDQAEPGAGVIEETPLVEEDLAQPADGLPAPDGEEPAGAGLPISPEELLCKASGGLWTVVGETAAFLCVKPTRDGGKACRKESDCDGQCLARSGTCAPYAPLYGCNDVLDRQGRLVTLCLG